MEPPSREADEDKGLQPERTTLAWGRTGIAATTAAIVTARVAIVRGSLVIAILAGVVAVSAVAGLITTSAGHAGRREWFHREGPGRGLPIVARMTVVSTVALCVIGVALVAGT